MVLMSKPPGLSIPALQPHLPPPTSEHFYFYFEQPSTNTSDHLRTEEPNGTGWRLTHNEPAATSNKPPDKTAEPIEPHQKHHGKLSVLCKTTPLQRPST
jgi:hypothetical protein